MKWIVAGYLLLFTAQQAFSQNVRSYDDYCAGKTKGGSGNGLACASVYTYKNRVYQGVCTNADHTTYWCATKPGIYETHRQWGECVPTSDPLCQTFCPGRTTGGNAKGKPCVIPFTYRGVTYNQCTTRAWTKPWCSTSRTYTGAWGECVYNEAECGPKFCEDRTMGGTGNGASCVVPFEYKGKTYTECTDIDNKKKKWCSMNSKYLPKKEWGNCLDKDCPQHCPARTVGGTHSMKACRFPFTYKGKTYTKCTSIDNVDKHWCSMEATWTRGKDWGNCVYEKKCKNYCAGRTKGGRGANGKGCVFPFTYFGKRYNACTSFEYGDKPWCSTDAVYKGNWGECIYDC